jgi:hypothetical protein
VDNSFENLQGSPTCPPDVLIRQDDGTAKSVGLLASRLTDAAAAYHRPLAFRHQPMSVSVPAPLVDAIVVSSGVSRPVRTSTASTRTVYGLAPG